MTSLSRIRDLKAPASPELTHPTQADDLARFEGFLKGILPAFLERTDGIAPARLQESIRYSLLAPGKRIRPRISMATGALFELPLGASLAAACAIEMVHCFTLIHDDLPCLDNDDFRRGRPSNHRQFDEATALLAGDALQAMAVEILLSAANWISEPIHVVPATRVLSWAMGPRGVIGGQVGESTLNASSTREDLARVHRGKTGALFLASILIPRELSGEATNSRTQILEAFGDTLGTAFQVMDDLEDDSDDQKRAPFTSILRHASRKEAAEETLRSLRQAQANLRAEWGPRAELLTGFGDEILQRIAGMVPDFTLR
jgi:geranylgeranyl pyrophosphate synthase